LINVTKSNGSPEFTFRPLPRIAQVAPVFGVVFTEANGDGMPDICIAQNFFGPQRETGRQDGGVSLLLLGNGRGDFTPVWPDRSGIVVAGDATSLTTSDFNEDGMPDLVVGINAAKQAVFEHSGNAMGKTLCLRLPPNAPPGTKVTLVSQDATQIPNQTAELHSGGGYLSQSANLMFFGLGSYGNEFVKEIRVRSPGGKETVRSISQLRMSGSTYYIDGFE
jgi:hypothetical protein